MGAVFRAEGLTLKRQVAIKVMALHLAADPEARTPAKDLLGAVVTGSPKKP